VLPLPSAESFSPTPSLTGGSEGSSVFFLLSEIGIVLSVARGLREEELRRMES
jgi:hypothetical protein